MPTGVTNFKIHHQQLNIKSETLDSSFLQILFFKRQPTKIATDKPPKGNKTLDVKSVISSKMPQRPNSLTWANELNEYTDIKPNNHATPPMAKAA